MLNRDYLYSVGRINNPSLAELVVEIVITDYFSLVRLSLADSKFT